ncbi:MAG: sigma 54-interacting transcriptional regulator [Verrucomicrobia bacterium]|nr:sigma 54-interacting transcriptional regulator [Verrucomicrobiota bacterium]
MRLQEALGESETFLNFQERLSRVSKVDRPVLIIGERGTGKELAARKLHYLSQRWQGPLVALNCSALAPSLIEDELFGHEQGAFTGATQIRRGRFEAAHEGTLLLDEIGNIPMEVQEKILRVVEYGEFERVGSSNSIRVDVRIIGATNADIPMLVEQNRFKADLLDRLAFEVLRIPPLRERHGDIMLLARHFAARMSSELKKPEPPEFDESAISDLERFPWPGNVRELKNVVERAVYLNDSIIISSIEFDPFERVLDAENIGHTIPNAKFDKQQSSDVWLLGEDNLPNAVKKLEIDTLWKSLQKSHFHQSEAAKLLGISYDQFRALLKKYKSEIKRIQGQS